MMCVVVVLLRLLLLWMSLLCSVGVEVEVWLLLDHHWRVPCGMHGTPVVFHCRPVPVHASESWIRLRLDGGDLFIPICLRLTPTRCTRPF